MTIPKGYFPENIFLASAEVMRIVSAATARKQDVAIKISAGKRECEPVDGWDTCEPDGSYDIHIRIKPPSSHEPTTPNDDGERRKVLDELAAQAQELNMGY